LNLGGAYFDEHELKGAGFKRLGKNVKVHNRASLYGVGNISLGDNVRIDDFAIIIATGGVSIGSYVQIANLCYLGGRHGIEIDDFSTLAPGVKLFSASDDYSGEKLTNPTVPIDLTGGEKGKVILKKHVIIGAGSVVLPNCVIGEGCSIGALSVVKKSLDPWGIYAGIPVRRIKDRKKELLSLERELTARGGALGE
jgi:acetyltransferase-like isoleucine patch superfamily enzyme